MFFSFIQYRDYTQYLATAKITGSSLPEINCNRTACGTICHAGAATLFDDDYDFIRLASGLGFSQDGRADDHIVRYKALLKRLPARFNDSRSAFQYKIIWLNTAKPQWAGEGQFDNDMQSMSFMVLDFG